MGGGKYGGARLNWREWEITQQTHFQPMWRWLYWISLVLSLALLVLSLIHLSYWSLFVAIGWALASTSYLARDALGRRQRQSQSTEKHV
jgi:hypothetical protein